MFVANSAPAWNRWDEARRGMIDRNVMVTELGKDAQPKDDSSGEIRHGGSLFELLWTRVWEGPVNSKNDRSRSIGRRTPCLSGS